MNVIVPILGDVARDRGCREVGRLYSEPVREVTAVPVCVSGRELIGEFLCLRGLPRSGRIGLTVAGTEKVTDKIFRNVSTGLVIAHEPVAGGISIPGAQSSWHSLVKPISLSDGPVLTAFHRSR